MNKTRKIEAIVLKKRPWKETDQIITIFSKEEGKLILRAKGVRRLKSRLGGALQTGNQLKIIVYETKTWDLITSIEDVLTVRSQLADIRYLETVYPAIELVDFTHEEEQAHPMVYQLLNDYLDCLIINEARTQNLFLAFKIQLIHLSGVLPELRKCTLCKNVFNEKNIIFADTEHNGFACDKCLSLQTLKISFRELKIFNFIQRGSLADISKIALSPADLYIIECFISPIIERYLNRSLLSPSIMSQF